MNGQPFATIALPMNVRVGMFLKPIHPSAFYRNSGAEGHCYSFNCRLYEILEGTVHVVIHTVEF